MHLARLAAVKLNMSLPVGSSDDFEELAQQLEQLADQYACNSVLVQATYRYAMQCERDFFLAAFEPMKNESGA